MNFNHDELMLMMLYNTGTRLGLIHEPVSYTHLKDPRKHPAGGHRQTAHLGAGNAAEGYSSHQQPL